MINDNIEIDMTTLDADSDGVHRGFTFRSPLCINTFRFDLYRDWTIDRILVFETFIIYTFKYGNQFYKTMNNLVTDLRLTEYTIRKNIEYLIDQGYLRKKNGSDFNNFKNIYTVDYDKIIEDIDQIYKFEILKEGVDYVRNLYINMFHSYDARSHPDSRDLYEGSRLFKGRKTNNG